ncbi:19882_t:CDS:2, partial [Rhizophagus irregularis]
MAITPILTENIAPNTPPDVFYEISPRDLAIFITTAIKPPPTPIALAISYRIS